MNVLIVRLSAMGDVIHSLPLAANLRRAGHRVGWVIERPYASLLAGNPDIDRVFELDSRAWRRRLFSGESHRGLKLAAEEIGSFRADAVLDPQGNEKSWWFSRLSKAPRLVLDDRSIRKNLTRRFSALRVRPPESARHVVEKNLALLSPLAVPAAIRVPQALYLLRGRSETAEEFLRSVRRPFGLYHPGAGWKNKAWGVEPMAALARAVEQRTGIAPVVSWGPGDERESDALCRLLSAPRIPASGFAGLAHFISAASFFVSGDTGPLHLADALGASTVSIFGPTSRERTGPSSGRGMAVSRSLDCSPCNRRYAQTKPCLLGIDPAELAREIAFRAP
jgi:lipopolysaccharide heptosyltransferase I